MQDGVLLAIGVVVGVGLTSRGVNKYFGHQTFHNSRRERIPQGMVAPRLLSPGSIELPVELAERVMTWLLPGDLVRTAQVCKIWAVMSNNEDIWRSLFMKAFKNRIPPWSGGSSCHALDEACWQGCWRTAFFKAHASHAKHLVMSPSGQRNGAVVIHGRVYNLRDFLHLHPGGEAIMEAEFGRLDSSDAFETFMHSLEARLLMKKYCMWDGVAVMGRTGHLAAETSKGKGEEGLKNSNLARPRPF
ncbi:unnamed protein product [Chrysoparadoxa australica]